MSDSIESHQKEGRSYPPSSEFSAKAHEVIADGNRLVSLGVYSGTSKATGKSMTAPFAHAWTVRDGRIAKFDMYTDTAKVLEALQA